MYSENILILTYWSYKDALIQTYTLPYVKIIRKYLNPEKKIFLRTLEQKKLSLVSNEKSQIENLLSQLDISWIYESYKKPGVLSGLYFLFYFFKLWHLCKKEQIGVIHIWCTPPSISAYFLSIVTGLPVIIDSYEPHAEAMVENGQWKKNSLKFKILFLFEKLISKRAQVVISATEGMRGYALEKYHASFEHFYVKPACVDLKLFSKDNLKNKELLKELGLEGKLICVYAGKFGGIYLEEEVFEFLKVAADFWGARFKALLLTSHSREQINSFCKRTDLNEEAIISLYVPHHLVASYMGLADFAITPVKPVPSKKYCTPIKDGEYWALGLPVVIPENISDDSEIIQKHQIGVVLAELTKENYLKAVKEIDALLKENKDQVLFEKIRNVAETYRNFAVAENIYSKIYN